MVLSSPSFLDTADGRPLPDTVANENNSEGSHMSDYMLNLEVIPFTGQNTALLNHRDPGSIILLCGCDGVVITLVINSKKGAKGKPNTTGMPFVQLC